MRILRSGCRSRSSTPAPAARSRRPSPASCASAPIPLHRPRRVVRQPARPTCDARGAPRDSHGLFRSRAGRSRRADELLILSACFIRPASSVIRSSFIRSLLSYPRRGQFLVTPRGGVFHGARQDCDWLCRDAFQLRHEEDHGRRQATSAASHTSPLTAPVNTSVTNYSARCGRGLAESAGCRAASLRNGLRRRDHLRPRLGNPQTDRQASEVILQP